MTKLNKLSQFIVGRERERVGDNNPKSAFENVYREICIVVSLKTKQQTENVSNLILYITQTHYVFL